MFDFFSSKHFFFLPSFTFYAFSFWAMPGVAQRHLLSHGIVQWYVLHHAAVSPRSPFDFILLVLYSSTLYQNSELGAPNFIFSPFNSPPATFGSHICYFFLTIPFTPIFLSGVKTPCPPNHLPVFSWDQKSHVMCKFQAYVSHKDIKFFCCCEKVST